MSKYWKLMMLEKYGSDEAVAEEMARRGSNSKGKPKKFNKLRDEKGYAKELRSRGVQSETGNKG